MNVCLDPRGVSEVGQTPRAAVKASDKRWPKEQIIRTGEDSEPKMTHM